MKKILVLAVFAFLFAIPLTSSSEAVLWDLIILAHVENKAIFPNDTPVISGQVIDQAGRPVENAKIQVRTGSDSIFTHSGKSGEFSFELSKTERLPGIYVISIIANSLDGKMGITEIDFQVKGELYPYSANELKLSTPEAQKYLNAEFDEFEGNSIGITLYNYYQGILKEYLEQKKIFEKLSEDQIILEEKRILAKQAKEKTIEEFEPGPGVYSGFKYEKYVENLDSSVKGIIVNQLNYTTNSFFEAQNIMDQILANGGTYQEARQAYLERLSMPRNLLDSMTTNQTQIKNVNQTNGEFNSTNSNNQFKNYTLEELISKEGVEVKTVGESIFVDVNGTSFKFILNGTEFILDSWEENYVDYSCTLANKFLICPETLENGDKISIEHGNRFTECNALIIDPQPSSSRKGMVSLGLQTKPNSDVLCPSIILDVGYHITGQIGNN